MVEGFHSKEELKKWGEINRAEGNLGEDVYNYGGRKRKTGQPKMTEEKGTLTQPQI